MFRREPRPVIEHKQYVAMRKLRDARAWIEALAPSYEAATDVERQMIARAIESCWRRIEEALKELSDG